MVVALLRIELHISGAQSLKDKRMVTRRLKDRLKPFNVGVAETAHQDKWQRAELAVVTVATDDRLAEQILQSVLDEIDRLEPGVMTRSEVEFLR
ncbi:MAG TPA: DUF503 domain-containing protein [Vicinamibacterales bacterium]|nr:DUF503 domain-containing protein [Vicinamibacterales bacterium]